MPSIFAVKIDGIVAYIVCMLRKTYQLELCVTEEGSQHYPAVGTVEELSSDNAGYDLKVVVKQTPVTTASLVPLGVKARMVCRTVLSVGVTEEECHFSLEPRSSIYKSGFMMANGRGIIDKSYRGQLMAPMISVGSTFKSVEAGTRLFQILAPDMGYIDKVTYVSELKELKGSVRGSGGFGSTG